jgi:hypothetical protein
MLREGTPVEDYREEYGLWVKREDLACPFPGPPFSKTRGVYARVKSRPERIIGALDTYHSQAGWAVARACQILGKKCIDFYPVYKHDWAMREPQLKAQSLGAELVGLPAGRSCILYHAAKKRMEELGGYMMPNALKLEESIIETAKEVPVNRRFDQVIIPASSGTIAAGVISGFVAKFAGRLRPTFIIHLGYSRSHDQVLKYLREKTGCTLEVVIIDEKYGYKDKAKGAEKPPWPCNEYYDLKAFQWHQANREQFANQEILLWNIG